ncbi:MAG TPA: response regulator [Planctomycetota bacterium]
MDDDSGFLLLAKRSLRQAGVPPENITSCPDGVEAKTLLEREASPPSLILIDQKMPRVSGIELLKWMRSKLKLEGVRVFMLSTSEDPEEVRKAYQLGVDGYLVKPVGMPELRTQLTDVLLFCVSPDLCPEVSGRVARSAPPPESPPGA